MDQVTEDLKTARNEILQRGWTRSLMNPLGQVCAVGALITATHPNLFNAGDVIDIGKLMHHTEDDRVVAAAKQLQQHLPNYRPSANSDELAVGDIEYFNDTHTEQDVLDLFDKTIANLGG